MTDSSESTPDPGPEAAAPQVVPQPEAPPAVLKPAVLAEPAEPAAAMTGHPVVDGALRALDGTAGAPSADQISAYEAAHHVLQQTLATIDES
jgi:hypothetical protein